MFEKVEYIDGSENSNDSREEIDGPKIVRTMKKSEEFGKTLSPNSNSAKPLLGVDVAGKEKARSIDDPKEIEYRSQNGDRWPADG